MRCDRINNTDLDCHLISILKCKVIKIVWWFLLNENAHHPDISISIIDVFVKESKFRFNATQKVYNFRKASYSNLYRELYETNIDENDGVVNIFYNKIF